MATLAELIVTRDALQRARFTGTLKVKSGEDEVTYKTDAEMKAALIDLERQITAAGGSQRISVVRISSSKGL